MAGETRSEIIPKKASALATPNASDSVAIRSLERFLEAAPKTTEALGNYMVSVGTFERTVGRSMESLASDFATQGGVEAFVRAAPPDVVAKFLQVMVRAARVGTPDLKKMNADQKIATGAEMKELAKEMRELVGAMKASSMTKGGK